MSSQLEKEAAFESGARGFLNRQLFMHRKPLPTGTKLIAQTAIISGSNSGLGFEAARQLLELDLHKLIMAVRSPSKGNEAATILRKTFPKTEIEVWALDMESYDSISAFVKRSDTLTRIDIVLLNAGINNPDFKITTATKHEQTVQVNYISTALLTILLLPVLKKKRPSSSKPSLLCIVNSDVSYFAKLVNKGPVLPPFDEEKRYSVTKSYWGSKFLQQLFITKLADQISADDVIINMTNPGLTKGTGLMKGVGVADYIFGGIKALLGRSTEVGASAYVDAVVRGKESHGSYVSDWKIQP
jgi:NAD(P)-dependent dehydrogenase (short-subunit alcohol dehydrogenase family)